MCVILSQVSVYLQRGRSTFHSKPDQKLTGSQLYGRFGSTIAPLGDLDKDGFRGEALIYNNLTYNIRIFPFNIVTASGAAESVVSAFLGNLTKE